MYLIDTNIISEARKGRRANPGARAFLADAAQADVRLFLSVITIGELRQGIDRMHYRGDSPQAQQLEDWLATILDTYANHILPLDVEIAQVWGRLRVPQACNALDKLIAATALIHDLCVVTRNEKDFQPTGARVYNPFAD